MRTKHVIIAAMVVMLTQTVIFSQEWAQVGCPQNEEGKNIPVFDLLNAGDVIYAATAAGVWRSTDYGMQWELTGLAEEIEGHLYPVTDLLIHDDVLYAAGDQVYRRTTQGDWERIGSKISYGCTNPQMTLAFFKGHLFANVPQCTGMGLYKLTNMTGNWKRVTNPGNFVIWSDQEIMYAGRKVTTDADTWSSLNGITGIGAVYSYTVTNGRHYLGAYTVGNTDAVYVSEDGINFSSFDNGLWRNTTGSSLASYGDSVFCLALDSDYLDNSTNHVQWADGESDRWKELGGPLYMSYDRSSLLSYGGWLYVACNGVEYKKIESSGGGFGGYERVGGYGIWRFVLDEASTHAGAGTDKVEKRQIQVRLDQSSRSIYLVDGRNADQALDFSLSLFSARGRRLSRHRIAGNSRDLGRISIPTPQWTAGIIYYRLSGNGLAQSGRIVMR